MPLRSPRTIAEKTNDPALTDHSAQAYDAEAGMPSGMSTRRSGVEVDYMANPHNPPVPAPPAKNLKR